MFIIPIEDKFSWKNPPLITILLIIICTAIYNYQHSHDAEQYAVMSEDYLQSGLITEEWPLFVEHIEQNNPELWQHVEHFSPEDARSSGAVAQIWYDRSFDQIAREYWDAIDPEMLEEREQFEQIRNSLTSIAYGLIPASISILTLFTSIFLHGSWEHLIGNMVFLALFGAALEKHLGRGWFLGLYIITGMLAGLSHSALDFNSTVPLVGASGAISGLMGIYIATYGVRLREFFFALGPLIGSFRAPSLIVLPFWLGKELINAALVEDQVAYMAHAGGIVAGVSLLGLMRATGILHRQIDESLDSDTQPHNRSLIPSAILKQDYNLRWREALKMCASQLEKPQQTAELWHYSVQLADRTGDKEWMNWVKRTLKAYHDKQLERSVVMELLDNSSEAKQPLLHKLPDSFSIILATLLIEGQRTEQAFALFSALDQRKVSHPKLTQLTKILIDQTSHFINPDQLAMLKRF